MAEAGPASEVMCVYMCVCVCMCMCVCVCVYLANRDDETLQNIPMKTPTTDPYSYIKEIYALNLTSRDVILYCNFVITLSFRCHTLEDFV